MPPGFILSLRKEKEKYVRKNSGPALIYNLAFFNQDRLLDSPVVNPMGQKSKDT
jgi:hypothetical protein